MSPDESFDSNLIRDLYMVSHFGTLEGMLEDIRRAQESKEKHTQALPHSPISSGRRNQKRVYLPALKGHRVVILPDDETRKPMGRGATMDALAEEVDDCPLRFSFGHELQEINSAVLRNETVEAYVERTQQKKQFEDLSLADIGENDRGSKPVVQLSGRSDAATADDQPPLAASPVSTCAMSAWSSSKPKKPKKPRNAVLQGYLANANKEAALSSDGLKNDHIAGTADPVLQTCGRSVVGPEEEDDSLTINRFVDFMSRNSPDSEIEVESEETYIRSDNELSSLSDELQKSVETVSDISGFSSSLASQKSGSSKGSKKGYHSTSRRNRRIPVSPLNFQNYVRERHSSIEKGNYAPEIVDTSFTFSKKDFPILKKKL